MSIITTYTLHHLKNNKRYTLSITVAILIASALLCSLCIFGHTLWKAEVSSTLENIGFWHGELWQSIKGEQLKYVTENPEVADTLIKGQWETAKIPESKRPYFLMRAADSNYWKDMRISHTLMDGRLPTKSDEIVVSKLFFNDNPQYGIGDSIQLQLGHRILGDDIISTQDLLQDGEDFMPTSSKFYTIVGTLDVTAVSAYPGYIAMGHLTRSDIKPTDELTVYMRMHNPRTIYSTLPRIAESVGFEKDEFGEYHIRYNTPLLRLYGIFQKNTVDSQSIIILGMALSITLLVMCTFILIIYNAFTLSANNRIKQLGMLKSLGATPKQIRNSILIEGLVLSTITIPMGIVIGYTFSNLVVGQINDILNSLDHIDPIHIQFSWLVVCMAIILSFITIMISAYIPARKVAKLSPLSAIKLHHLGKTKISTQWLLQRTKTLPIIKNLALSQFLANKRAYRSSILALTMCFTLITGYMSVVSIVGNTMEADNQLPIHDLSLTLDITYEPDPLMVERILSIPGIDSHVLSRSVGTTFFTDSTKESEQFAELGGLSSINTLKYSVYNQDDQYRLLTQLVGLDGDSYEDYCAQIGYPINQAKSHEGLPKAILYDSTYHRPTQEKKVYKVPMLSLPLDETVTLWEKVDDQMNTDNHFNLHIGCNTELKPTDLGLYRYNVAFIVPMHTYQKLVSGFMPYRKLESQRVKVDLLVGLEDHQRITSELEDICNDYLGKEDFRIWSYWEDKNLNDIKEKAIHFGVMAIACMIGLIGLFHAFSSISNNISSRRREFAILRSVGMTPVGLRKLLLLEGLCFALFPILLSLPLLVIICWFMLWLTLTTWLDFIGYYPFFTSLCYALIMIVTIWLSYIITARHIHKDNIIDAIKDETT